MKWTPSSENQTSAEKDANNKPLHDEPQPNMEPKPEEVDGNSEAGTPVGTDETAVSMLNNSETADWIFEYCPLLERVVSSLKSRFQIFSK